ncbi:MAG: nitroreductase family protein [Salinivirgaceae bacterium]|nr:nitroreductase family protein [Salinivirgaceae bacterium]
MKKTLFMLVSLFAMVSCTSPQVKNEVGDASQVVDSVIMARRSVRQYTDKTISRDMLNQVLKSGINAPNGQGRQAYEIRVVDNPEMLAAITMAVLNDNQAMKPQNEVKNIFAGAPCVVFIANDTTYDMSQVDCGLLGQNIILSAWSKGIASCCMAYPVRLMKESKLCAPLIAKLGFSQGYNLLYSIALGYANESPNAKPRKTEKIKYVD